MSDRSAIEWTDATWNPLVGCSVHSPGCKRCYAMRTAWRLMHNPNPKVAAKFAGTAEMTKAGPVFTGRINLDEEALLAPLRRKTPSVYFVNSLSDLFHVNVPDDWIDRIFAVMALCRQHTFQVLTKRADRMRAYFQDWHVMGRVHQRVKELVALHPEWRNDARQNTNQLLAVLALDKRWPLANVWLGVSVEDQKRADERIPDLLATRTAVRFLSCEPLLGPVNLNHVKFADRITEAGGREMGWESALNGLRYDIWADDDEDPMKPGFPKLDWVICGGESGPKARPMHPDWARSLRDQCAAAGVPFFFKQWGEWSPSTEAIRRHETEPMAPEPKGSRFHWFGGPAPVAVERIGKKAAGRQIDGIEHSGMPAHG